MTVAHIDNLTVTKADGLRVRSLWAQEHYANDNGVSALFFVPRFGPENVSGSLFEYQETSGASWGTVFRWRSPDGPRTMHVMVSSTGGSSDKQRFRLIDSSGPLHWMSVTGSKNKAYNRGFDAIITTDLFALEYQLVSAYSSTGSLPALCVVIRCLDKPLP